MNRRLELQAKFEELLGSRNVYFQPPENLKIGYPAIIYRIQDIENGHADDSVYMQHNYYEVIVIDEDPDSVFVTKVSQLPTCRYNRHYTADNLNHDVFVLHY